MPNWIITESRAARTRRTAPLCQPRPDRDLLPIINNVERAIEAAEKNADAAALLEGFKMVSRQLDELLKLHHCTRIEALHAPFDPNVHHAIMQQPSEEHPANTVLTVTQNGYQLHDRVVRPSQVIVSTPK